MNFEIINQKILIANQENDTEKLDNILSEVSSNVLDIVIHSLRHVKETREFIRTFLIKENVLYEVINTLFLEKSPQIFKQDEETVDFLMTDISHQVLFKLFLDISTEQFMIFLPEVYEYMTNFIHLLDEVQFKSIITHLFVQNTPIKTFFLKGIYFRKREFEWVTFSIKYKNLEMLSFLRENGEDIVFGRRHRPNVDWIVMSEKGDDSHLCFAIFCSSREIVELILNETIDKEFIKYAIDYAEEIEAYHFLEILNSKLI